MKTKYMMSWGLAFAEKYEMKKLEKKASEGWLLEGFAFFGYNLVQGPKQELTYTLDIQAKPDKDYFDIFSSAGWRHITSCGNQYHIFTAPKGTPPIYSDDEIAEGKYKDFTTMTGKIAVYSFFALIVFSTIMIMTKMRYGLLFYSMLVPTFISYAIFICSFLPYVAYKIKHKNRC